MENENKGEYMKTALVLEGGAMRGIYTSGVLDVFIEKNITFDGVIGVSAGALFGVNFLSKQKGRVIRYNKKYNRDRNYMGIIPLLRTGNIIDTEYAYKRVPFELDPFDNEEYMKSSTPFYAILTNLYTGKAEYYQIKSVYEQIDYLRASGSMPFVSKPVNINGAEYLDGAIADSIPYEYMLNLGYDRVVVILTKPDDYVKKPISRKLIKLFYKKKYPIFAETLKNRNLMYNDEMENLRKLEKEGIAKIIRPSMKLKFGKMERDNKRLDDLYNLGVKDAYNFLESLKEWIPFEN